MKAPLLNIHQVRERLNVSGWMVRTLLSTGKLVGTRVGRAWRVDESDLEQFIEQRKTKSVQVPPAAGFDADDLLDPVEAEYQL